MNKQSRQRQWIRYEDGSYEPVRMSGDILNKKRGSGIPLWWIMDMPKNWMPQHNGYIYTSNHPSGALSRRFDENTADLFTKKASLP